VSATAVSRSCAALGDEVRRRQRGNVLMLLALSVLACVAGFGALFYGSTGARPAAVLEAVLLRTGPATDVVWELRLPRVLMAMIIGASLAASGTVTQSVLRNPLASPFTLGIASGAGFGAALAIWLGSGSRFAVALGAFVCSLCTSLVILGVARMRGARPETLILTGIAVMYFFSALTSLLQYISPMDKVQAILFWLFGSLARSGWVEAGVAACFLVPSFVWIMRRAWDFNTIPAGDDTARVLGVPVDRLRVQAILCASAMTAGAICFTGTIGFVGLVGPHMARMLVGTDHRVLIPAASLIGVALVLGADVLGRAVVAPVVIPIGIVTSFLGVPFFVWLLMRQRREMW
jgi:iron complex transport system permease protein